MFISHALTAFAWYLILSKVTATYDKGHITLNLPYLEYLLTASSLRKYPILFSDIPMASSSTSLVCMSLLPYFPYRFYFV